MRLRGLLFGLSLLGFASSARGADSIQIAVAARAYQPGELLVLTLSTAAAAETLTVRAFGRDTAAFRIDPRTWRALIGIDLDTAPGRYTFSVTSRSATSTERATTAVVVSRRSFPTRHLKVQPGFVNPPPEELERIAREAKDLERVWTQSAPTRLWDEPFVRPVPGQANSAFGSRSIFNGQPRSPHSGGDFLSPAGTPVLAPNAGQVLMARNLYFTGNVVVIDHGMGLFSLLAHLSVIDAHEGQTVTAGQRIGEVGATGRVTGPHLHWAVRVGRARVDPLSLLEVLGAR